MRWASAPRAAVLPASAWQGSLPAAASPTLARGRAGQVISFEVVLADGSVVEASEQQISDLWLALRGGCNNFGIITSLDIKTFEQGLLWSSLTLNPLSAVDQQAQVYAELMDPAKYDENASFLFGWSFNSTHKLSVALSQLIYTKPSGNEVPAFYQPVLDLPTIQYPSAGATVANMSTLARQGAHCNRHKRPGTQLFIWHSEYRIG